MFLPSLLASVEQAEEILKNGVLSQEAIAQSMAQLWNAALHSPLYKEVANFGTFFFLITLGLFVVNWWEQMESGSFVPWKELLTLFLTLALLMNEGNLLRDFTLGGRDLMNHFSTEILKSSLAGSTNLIDAFNQVSQAGGLQSFLNQELARCEGLTDPQAKSDCIAQATQKVEAAAKAGASNSSPNLWQRVTGGFSSVIGGTIEMALIGFLIGFGVAIQWLVEISWILMGLTGPVFVGLTLLPVRQKALFMWLIGFFSLGFYKLLFNMLVGMVAMVQLQAGSVNNLIFSIATGLLSPILAGVLAAGGGMALFTSLAGTLGAAGASAGASAAGAASSAVGSAAGAGTRIAYHSAMGNPNVQRAVVRAVPSRTRRRIRGLIRDARTPIF